MALDVILAKLTEEERAEVLGAIDTEKTRGIEASRKKGDEIKKILTAHNTLKDKVRDGFGIDPDADLDDQIAEAKRKLSTAKSGGESDEAIRKLQKQVDALTTERDTERKDKEAARAKLTTAKLTETLGKLIGERVYGSDLVIEKLIRDGRVKLNEDETPVFVDGDNEQPLDKGLEGFLKSRPDLVKNQQAAGGGSSSKPGASGNKKTMPYAEWLRLSPKDRAQFITGGGVTT